MERDQVILTERRDAAVSAKVGTYIICPSCGTEHLKTQYNTIFCKKNGKRACKDNFWNNVDENKKNNINRITESRASWLSVIGINKLSSSLASNGIIIEKVKYIPKH
jgi:hypothetical protein